MIQELTERILLHVEKCGKVDTLDLVNIFNEDHQKIVGALKSIQAHDENILKAENSSIKTLQLTEEGSYMVTNGSHEAVLYNSIPEAGISQNELMKTSANAKVGFSKAMSQGWILVDKSVNPPVVKKKVPEIVDAVRDNLVKIQSGEWKITDVPANILSEYKKRKLLQEVVTKSFLLSKGSDFTTKLTKLETDLTVDMLASGLWKDLKFKAYNFDALGAPPTRGHLHPLLKVRTEFRQIFLEMGFSEMPTNNYVESSFWNFDALFQPQQHPARDAHDTFFIDFPSKSNKFPMDYLEKVKTAHSQGAYGSKGYGYNWKIEEAQKNLLRTHTTAVSARMLYKLANQPGGFKPAKYFSIDKVFRNETLDATHLAEFHQVEGVVADVGLTLGDLIGTIYEFFKKLGITQLEFKPAYNPYTEPSMEIFCFHPGLKKWIEVGNSGLFRPEMLLPMGIPSNVNVIAWGLSLERPTMIKYGFNNIRDLVGPKVDFKMVEEAPICRLDRYATFVLFVEDMDPKVKRPLSPDVSSPPHKRQKWARLLLRELYDLGCHDAAAALEREASVQLRSDAMKKLQKLVANRQWDQALQLVTQTQELTMQSPRACREAALLLLQRKYVDFLLNQQLPEALRTFQEEILPVFQPSEAEVKQLAELLLCRDAEEMKQRAKMPWQDDELQLKLEGLVSPEEIIPEGALRKLVQDGLEMELQVPTPRMTGKVTADCLEVLLLHKNDVWELAFSPDGEILASASSDGSVVLWEIKWKEDRFDPEMLVPSLGLHQYHTRHKALHSLNRDTFASEIQRSFQW